MGKHSMNVVTDKLKRKRLQARVKKFRDVHGAGRISTKKRAGKTASPTPNRGAMQVHSTGTHVDPHSLGAIQEIPDDETAEELSGPKYYEADSGNPSQHFLFAKQSCSAQDARDFVLSHMVESKHFTSVRKNEARLPLANGMYSWDANSTLDGRPLANFHPGCHVHSGSPVSVKVYKTGNEARHLFEREVTILSQITGIKRKHTPILSLHAVAADPPCIVLDSFHSTLRHALNLQMLTCQEKTIVAKQVRAALIDLHEEFQLLYLNLSPRHVVLNGGAQLADFEFVEPVQSSTRKFKEYCTPRFRAPELWKNRHHVTTAADVWSYGLLLWSLGKGDGTAFFTGSSRVELRKQITAYCAACQHDQAISRLDEAGNWKNGVMGFTRPLPKKRLALNQMTFEIWSKELD